MKKIIISLFITLLILPLVLALNLEVEKVSKNEVMIVGIDKPTVFDLNITNLGPDENIEFYNLLGFRMFPLGTIFIKTSETKEIQLKISPIGEFTHEGSYTFNYFIKNQEGSEIKKTLTFKRIKLQDAFEIGAGEFDPESNSIEVYIKNNENFDFGEISAKFSSAFFDFEKTFNLGSNQRKNFSVELNKEDFKQLLAGFYAMDVEIQAEDQKAILKTNLKFVEKNIIISTEKSYGFVVSTKIIKKTNEGNVLAMSETNIKKNIISRLFTSFSPDPDIVDRQGLAVNYIWNREIKPGETLEIAVKTNWLFPFLIILLIITIVILAKQYTKTNLVIRKKVSFVRAKGGEFALKVSIFVNAKKYIEKVNIIDRLPPLVKIYEKFGAEKPSKIDHKLKRIEWNFEKLEAGEIRMLSYIIYSKIGVLGKFALPSTKGIYEKDGEIHESESNRAFFIAEQRSKDLEEE